MPTGFDGALDVTISTREVFIGTLHGGLRVFSCSASAANFSLPASAAAITGRGPAAAAGQNNELQKQKAELEAQNLRFDAALNNMSHGLCLYDRDQKLIVCNASYVQHVWALASPGRARHRH